MKALLDSSTLIAGMLTDHIHHAPAHAWIGQARNGAYELVVSGHSIAEVYSVLTRLPRVPPISPADAWQMLKDNVVSCATIATLSDRDYVALIEELAQQSVSGGMTYDAIIAKAAELSQIDHLVTLNEAHFKKVWPAGAAKIVSPLTMAPPVAKPAP